VERIGRRVGVQDDDRAGRVARRREGIEVTQVESLVTEGRSEVETGEVV